jgi:hypothetical protein
MSDADAHAHADLSALRAWDPPGEPPPDPGARARARARLNAHVAAARPGRRAPRLRPSRRWLVTVPATVAIAAAIAVLVVVLGTSRVPEQRRSYSAATAPTTAAQALEQAARAAETGSPAFPRPEQFFYTFTEATYLACALDAGASYCALSSSRRESWISEERRGQVRTKALGVTWPSAAERRKWVAAGRPSLALATAGSGTTKASPNHAFYLGNERLSAAQMRDFAQSGAQLYRRVHDGVTEGQGPSRDGETFVQLNDALRGLPTSPRLRAALFRAFAFVPRIGFVAHAKDRLGRPAVAITHVEQGTRHEILFDPRTSALLGERDVVAGPVRNRGYSAPEGTVVGDAAYRDQGVVDAIGERP